MISDQVVVTISIQHLLALGTAVLAWWTVRRLSGSDWLGLIPAAVVLLNGDALVLEHSVMSETLFTFLVLATLAAAVGALDAARPWRWLVLAGALLGGAIWVRYAAVGLVPVLAVWALVAFRPVRRDGLVAAAAALVPVIVLVGLLVVLQGKTDRLLRARRERRVGAVLPRRGVRRLHASSTPRRAPSGSVRRARRRSA